MKSKTLIWLLLFALASISCVTPAALPASRAYIAPEVGSAPAPVLNMVVCKTDPLQGGLRIRSAPGVHNRQVGLLTDGTVVAVSNITAAEDMGLWYQVDGGWINARYLCRQ